MPVKNNSGKPYCIILTASDAIEPQLIEQNQRLTIELSALNKEMEAAKKS
jgi:hypothetical protein